jgi:hypothetical protein
MVAVLALACRAEEKSNDTVVARAAPAPVVAAAPGACPRTGLWAECSVMERLKRAGLVARIDSTKKASEKGLTREGLLVHLGRSADLSVYLYADSNARAADEKQLDRAAYVDPSAPVSIKRERTLIRNGNLLALLTSINDQQRERVANALLAGAPQP